MSVFNGIKDYLEMHKRERLGISVLLGILGIILLTMFIIPHVVHPEVANKEEVERKIQLILEAEKKHEERLALEKENSYTPKKKTFEQTSSTTKTTSKKELKLFEFDPNTCSDAEWKKLGLNSGQVKTIKNFKSKGGKFYKPEDLGKMYTIDSEQYSVLRPFIKIDKSQFYKEDKAEKKEYADQWKEQEGTEEAEKDVQYINLNIADTIELVKLSGIGPYYARKIVEYRNELGGFRTKEQLLEIWNFKSETLDKISEQIHLGEEAVKQISINHCNAEELAEHPYFNWKMANALVTYREVHGPYSSIEEITKSHLITEEACLKMKPYLKLN